MSERKYQKTEGWWVYVLKTPDNKYYTGYSGGNTGAKQPKKRFQPSLYKTTALYRYIEQFGWDKIEKLIVKDKLTKVEAIKLEDKLICMYRNLGCCINKTNSGGISQTTEYQKELTRKYRQTDKGKEYCKNYNNRPEVKERKKEWIKQKRLKLKQAT